MNITDAKRLIGKTCSVCWADRTGNETTTVSRVHDVTFERLYGGFLILDREDVPIEKITMLHLVAEDGSTVPVYGREAADLSRAA